MTSTRERMLPERDTGNDSGTRVCASERSGSSALMTSLTIAGALSGAGVALFGEEAWNTWSSVWARRTGTDLPAPAPQNPGKPASRIQGQTEVIGEWKDTIGSWTQRIRIIKDRDLYMRERRYPDGRVDRDYLEERTPRPNEKRRFSNGGGSRLVLVDADAAARAQARGGGNAPEGVRAVRGHARE